MEMIYVEPGNFSMGSDTSDSSGDEKPVHEVTLTIPFEIGKYPVTQGEYEKLMGKNPAHFKFEKVWGLWGGQTQLDHPVENLTWKDAVNFCKTLTKQEREAGRLSEDQEYRLPTEAEWEYAARGGPKSEGFTFPGSEKVEKVAWNNKNSQEQTHPVGEKEPNELGIYDMGGNVWEWCVDCYQAVYYLHSPPKDPVNISKIYDRVFRGGSWESHFDSCRCSCRDGFPVNMAGNYLGFRVVRAPVRTDLGL